MLVGSAMSVSTKTAYVSIAHLPLLIMVYIVEIDVTLLLSPTHMD